MNTSNPWPMALREFTKNNKNQTKKHKNKEKEKEKENLNKSQNILLYKILKSKNKNFNGNISMDSSNNIKKTIENTIANEENKNRVLKFLKNNNRENPKTSLSSPSRRQNPGKSPNFFYGEDKKNENNDSYITNKNNYNNKTATNSRKVITNYKAVTPVGKYKNRSNLNNLNNSMEKRLIYGAIYKKKETKDLFLNGNKANNYNPNAKDEHNISYNNEKRDLSNNNIKYIKNEKEVNHSNASSNKKKKDKNDKKNIMKYNYLVSTYSSLVKQNDKLNITKNSTDNNKNHNANVSHNYNSSISSKHKLNNCNYKKKTIKDYYNFNDFKASNYSTKKEKEFDNLQNKNVELFTIYQSDNSNTKNIIFPKLELKTLPLYFKNLTSEKSNNFVLKCQSKKKEIEKESKNIIKGQYTGYILTKKNSGIIEKELKIENNFDKLSNVFKSILSEIANEQYEFISLKELLKLKNEINNSINVVNELNTIKSELALKEHKILELNTIKSELALKEQKIKEFNAIQNELALKEQKIKDLNKIQNELLLKGQKIKELTQLNEKREEEYFENQKECLKLKSEIEKIKSENQKMKEKISLMEKENKKITEDNGKLKEDALNKNKKDEKMSNEIKDLENKIKKYKEELKKTNNINNNNLRSTFNIGNVSAKNKRFSVSYNFKMESLIKNLENKNKNKNKVSKFIVDDNKIKEDTEDKDEKDRDSNSSKSSDSEKTMSDKLKDIDNKENKNKNKTDAIVIEEKAEKELNSKEPIIKNIIINNISNNINNNINNKNEIEIKKVDTFPNIEIKSKNALNEEKQKKMSNALNRFKKKISKQKEEENEIERKGSTIKKSNRISGMAKILEKQMGAGAEKKEEKSENKPIKDNEGQKESNIVDLIDKKPTYNGRRRKPTLHTRFIQKKQDEE